MVVSPRGWFGHYYDYSQSPLNHFRLGCAESSAGIATQFLGIWVVTTLSSAVKMINRLRILAERKNQNQNQAQNQNPYHNEIDINVTIEGAAWNGLLNMFPCSRSGSIRIPGQQQTMRILPTGGEIIADLILCVIYVGFITFGVLTNSLIGDNTTLAQSDKCGVYIPNAHDLDQLNKVTTPYDFDMQTQSAEYARRCYGKGDSTDGCDIFVQQEISYTKTDNDSCPFLDDSMCHGGSNGAYTLSTGAISAKALGINTRRKYEFIRTSTCTPLNMNASFITSEIKGNATTFKYNYGQWIWNNTLQNPIFKTYTYGDFVGKGPLYSVGVFSSLSGYIPIPQLNVGRNKILTLMLILPEKIFYTEPSSDPIFPTTGDGVILPPGNTTKYWMYQAGHSRALACVDTIRWRDRQQGLEWRLYKDFLDMDAADAFPGGDLELLAHSLLRSYTYHSISKRLGAGLNATSRISISTSLPLAKEQWKVEVTQLFETSLARASFDARNVAFDTQAEYEGYIRPRLSPSMCNGMYLYRKVGWTSVNATGYWTIFSISTLVIFLVATVKNFPGEQEKILMFEKLCAGREEDVAAALVKIVSWTFKVFSSDLPAYLLTRVYAIFTSGIRRRIVIPLPQA